MDIQITSSSGVEDKLHKLVRKSSVKIVEDAKVVLVERGYEMQDNKISIVFDAIDYDEVWELLTQDSAAMDLEEHKITGLSNDRYSMIDISEILYLEAQGAQVNCFTANGEYNIKKTLSYYETELKSQGILRINKSQIVNMKNVKEIIPWFNSRLVFVLENGKELEVSKLYSKAIRKLLNI